MSTLFHDAQYHALFKGGTQALACLAQLVEHHLMYQEATDWIPG